MKSLPTFGKAVTLGLCLSPGAFAVTATSLSSFGGIEEPAVIYRPSSNSFVSDSYVNITNVTSGTIQTLLRYSTSQWDGDRTTDNTDRGRAEVKTLGANQRINETFDYTTTWRTNSGFKGSGAFCHITQLKGTNGTEGSSGAPLVVTSINSGTTSAVVRYASTSFSPTNVFTTRTVRNITWAPNTWCATRIRIRTSADGANTGQVLVSLNGDSLQGVTNTEVSRPEATNYYPKWGLYRKQEVSSGFSANDYIQHSNVSASLVTTTTPPPTTVNMEAESLAVTSSGATVSTGADTAASGGTVAYLNADGVGDYVEYTTPSIAAGNYQIKFRFKRNTARGQHTLTIDGAQVGGTIDEYGTQTYTEVTVGTKSLTAGTHKIRLTVTGRNASSTSYVLAPDRFSFVGQ